MSERLRSLEKAIEVALTVGVVASGLLLVAGLALGAPTPLRLGILMLMFTPVARVLVLTVGLFAERDWVFGATSLFVLAVLASGVWVGFHR